MAGLSGAIRRLFRENIAARYCAALAAVAVALGLRRLIGDAIPGAPFITFFPAIVGCAYLLGRGPAILCTSLSAAAAWAVFIRPAASLTALWPSAWLTVAYLLIAVTIVLLFDRLRGAIARLQVSETERQALMHALEDRVAARTAELSAANDRLRHEIGERIKAEEAIAQLARLEAMGQLVGGVSHDFNNYLHVIIANLDMARRRGERPGPSMRIHVDAAHDAARKAAALTQRLLAFGRKQALEPAAVDINALVEGLADLLAHSAGATVELSLDLQPDLPAAWIDGVQLESAVLNLAVNARDAMPDGGQLRIITRAVAAPGGGQAIELAVADTGTGMSPAAAARAFEPFFTTKAPGRGTGLGLSQIHGFMQQSGGDVRLQSAEGQGTCVTLRLPQCPEGVAAAAEPGRLHPGQPIDA